MQTPTELLRRHAIVLAFACLAWLCFQSAAVACPTCAEGVANDPNHANLMRGYFWSIIFMMSMPFLILAGLCSYFYFEVRRARANQVMVDLPAPGPAALLPGAARSSGAASASGF